MMKKKCVQCGGFKGEWHMYPSGVCHRCHSEARGERLKLEAHEARMRDKRADKRADMLESKERRKYNGRTREEHFAHRAKVFAGCHAPYEDQFFKQCDVCGLFEDFPKSYRMRSGSTSSGGVHTTCRRCRNAACTRKRRADKSRVAVERQTRVIDTSRHEGIASVASARREWKRLTKSSQDSLVRFNRRSVRGFAVDESKHEQRLREQAWHAEVWECIEADRRVGVVQAVAAYFDLELLRVKHDIPVVPV